MYVDFELLNYRSIAQPHKMVEKCLSGMQTNIYWSCELNVHGSPFPSVSEKILAFSKYSHMYVKKLRNFLKITTLYIIMLTYEPQILIQWLKIMRNFLEITTLYIKILT